MITSKLTSKGRTTVPQPVRIALHLQVGDTIAYQIEGDQVVIAGAAEAPFTTFSEWASVADQRAYANL